jgi:hypothetical protein
MFVHLEVETLGKVSQNTCHAPANMFKFSVTHKKFAFRLANRAGFAPEITVFLTFSEHLIRGCYSVAI